MARNNNSDDYRKGKEGKKNFDHKMNKGKRPYRGKQGRKDSPTKRVNYDNAREDKVRKAVMAAIEGKVQGYNDIEWYNHNPELLKAAGTIPFASISGKTLGLPAPNQIAPGVMTLGWSIGLGPEGNIALNQAKDSMYSFLVHANSRNYSYDPADYMILVLAGAAIFSTLSHIIRAYGVAKYYVEQNLYSPDTYLTAMGFDPSDFRKNLGNIWFQINEWVARSAQIWIPNTMPILKRWFWMNQYIYKDDNDPKGQVYMYVPEVLYRYNATSSNTGGMLEPVIDSNTNQNFNPHANFYTWQDWVTVVNSMFNALILDQDRGTIYGDILNAYGPDKIYTLSSIPADYMIAPIYNAEVLMQFENATWSMNYIVGVHQLADGRLQGTYSNKQFAGWIVPPLNGILNVHIPGQPSPEMIIELTRSTMLKGEFNERVTNASGAMTKTNIWYPTVVGSEIITGARVWKLDINLNVTNYMLTYPELPTSTTSWDVVADLMSFDWHPFIYQPLEEKPATPAAGQVGFQAMLAAGDLSNYTTLHYEELTKLHETAMLSLFGVPQM